MSVCEYKKRKPYTLDSKTDTFCLCPLLHLDVLYVPSFCDDVDDYDMGVFNDLDWKLEKSSFSNGIFFVKEPLWAKTWQRNS